MSKKVLQGRIKRHPDGFGFFIPEQSEHPDVYIPRQSMSGAMTNDQVTIEVFAERNSDRFRGEIIDILKRGTTSVVGTLQKNGIIQDDGKGWGEDLKVDSKDTMDAKPGELVSVQILSYPGERGGFRGKIVDVIGDSLDPLTDVKRVLFQNSIPQEFPGPVIQEAQKFSEYVSEADMKNRRDIRQLNFITIDGATAKDFDDAIYVETNNQGFLLYVAIADVSHYVQEGSAIDKEAYLRGTSVYFPNFVVPMLPEILSNGLCSLNPHLPRLSLVAEIQMDFTGEMLKTNFYEAVIESKARVTYGEAQEVIDGNPVPKLEHVKEEILRASDLAKILMAKRFKDGSLDLEIPETQIIIDSSGMPTDFVRTSRLFAHRLIEEMMLSANVAVAKFFADQEIPGMYRVHEAPNADAIQMLEMYLHNFGSRVELGQGKLQKRLTKSLQEFSGKPEAEILNILALRSMSQAKYSANNLGHFGLGFEFYTHFTSPIRRYPDLIVHRLVKSQILENSRYHEIEEDDLQTAATMLSATEQRSVKAERQFQAIKKARFMQKYLGEEFDGIISSVTKFGVFVLLRQFEVDGLVRMESLSKEKLEFNEDTLTLVGTRSGRTFSLGDKVRIQVATADPDAGQVDFVLVLDEAQQAEEKKYFVKTAPRGPREGGRSGGGRNQKPRSNERSERPEARRGKSGSSKKASGGSHKERDERNERPERSNRRGSPKNKIAQGQQKNQSRKLQAAKKIEERGDTRAEQTTDRRNPSRPDRRQEKRSEPGFQGRQNFRDTEPETKKPGGFDPEAHLRNAMDKWKKRSDVSAGRNLTKKKDEK